MLQFRHYNGRKDPAKGGQFRNTYKGKFESIFVKNGCEIKFLSRRLEYLEKYIEIEFYPSDSSNELFRRFNFTSSYTLVSISGFFLMIFCSLSWGQGHRFQQSNT